MSTNEKPAPLVPADADLTKFDFMPLDVKRLRDSELASDADPASSWFAVLLWCTAWHQIPAGSVPDNDAWLAKAVGFGREVGKWIPHKEFALRGFVACSDGRLYHRVVCEKALDAWISKLKAQLYSGRGNKKRWGVAVDEDALRVKIAQAERMLAELTGQPVPEPPQPPAPPPPAEDPPPAPSPALAKEPAGEPEAQAALKEEEVPPAGKRRRGRPPRATTIIEPKYSAGFEAWWDAYPNTRKVNKAGCWEKWKRDQLEDFAETLLTDVRQRVLRDWKWMKNEGEYVPSPIVYLNQHRWNDPFTDPPRGGGGGRSAATEARNDATADEWARDGA